MTLQLVLTIVFLCLNTFFVLAEFALVKAQRPRLEVMRRAGRTRATLVIAMMDNMDNYLSAIQIGVTMSTLGLGWAGEPAIAAFLSREFNFPLLLQPYASILTPVIAFCVIVYTQIVFAELLPRFIAIQKPEAIALWAAIPLTTFYNVLRGPIVFMAKSSKFFSRLLGLKSVAEHQEVFTEDEVRVLLGMSQEKGLLPLDRLLLIENLFDFEHLKVRDAMVPQEKVVFLSTAKAWDENRRILDTNHFSRYPLGHPDLNHVIGFIHLKDLALQGAGIPDLVRIARPLSHVEEGTALQPLLKIMTSQGKHVMLVTKAGKPVGLITLEDVIEELVGEILDEFDAPHAWSFQNLLTADTIDLDLKATTPLGVVQSLTRQMKNQLPGLDLKAVESAVMARETQLPTTIGRGVAVPHVRLPSIDRAWVAIGRSKHALSYAAPDKTPVKLVFLILTPASQPLEQLRILARVVTLARNETLLKQMMRAKTPAQFLDTIRTSEPIVVG